MQYYRCKCGHMESYSSMGVALCEVCEKCGTTMAIGPKEHLPKKDHSWMESRVMTDEGEKVLTICRQCGKKRIDIEKEDR